MSFFDFLKDTDRYADKDLNIGRLDRRREFIIDPYVDDLKDARVLDLASHDGRWSYALSAAGAREVVGIEARGDLIAQFESYPEGAVKDRISFIQADVFEELPRMIGRGEKFDVVAVYGLYYHIMDHYTLLKLVKQLSPRLVIIDSEFLVRDAPLIRLATERTGSHLNSISHETGQDVAPIGVPSRPAVEMMAGSLGYDVTWADWDSLPRGRRQRVHDYFRANHWKRRGTCALRPR